MVKIAPSILSADFSRLLDHVKEVEKAGVEYLHVDVMDGHFVPNISFGAPILNALKGKTSLFVDVHLMIETPDRYIEDFVKAGADLINVHVEACTHLHRTIQLIKSYSVKAAVTLNPATPLTVLDEILPELDMVLLMSVNPGFGGQSYIQSTTDKIKRLKQMITERNLQCEIEVDGGVNLNNVKEIVDAGADVIVAGSAIFNTEDISKTVKAFRAAL
ncbi:MAG: ribulose-phosphate 3-epimerase [Clostridiales bacterium 38-18]|nr:MAG: ribulose-phosphate 3-epimerase [Clostridiales bacterium 38-18]